MAEDVVVHGAGTRVQGRQHVESAVDQAGLTCTGIEVQELFAAGDRVVGYFTQHLRHDATVKLRNVQFFNSIVGMGR